MNVFLKAYRLLSSSQRKEVRLLLPLMVLGMLLEAISLGAIVPATGVMISGNFSQYPLLSIAGDRFKVFGDFEPITFAMIGLAILFLIKNSFLAFLAWRQATFSYSTRADLSNQLFSHYLHQPYAFHLQRNSAQLIRNVTTEASLFAVAINGIMTIITEFLITLGVIFILLRVEPMGALIAIASLGSAAWIFYRFTKKKILRWGQGRQHHDGMQLQHLQQGLGAIKDISILGRQAKLIDEFSEHSYGISRVEAKQSTLQQIPRLWLELLAVFGLAVLVLTMKNADHNGAAIVPVLALFAAAAFRLLPSLNRVLAATQFLRYGMPAIDLVYADLYVDKDNRQPDVFQTQNQIPPPFENEIEVSNISYHYPDSINCALNGISFSIKKGSCVGFIGSSGAGKSTLVDVILGLLSPQGGEIKVDSIDIEKNKRWWQDQIGYVPQSVTLIDSSLKANIAFGVPVSEIDEGAIKLAIQSAQLEDFIDSLPKGLETQVGERGVRLSGGQLQRIGIARALYHNPPVLVLDEATSALDSTTEDDVMQAVNALHGNKTILIIAHRLSTVRQCDFLYSIEGGKVVGHGVPHDILDESTY
jgi:ABC-type multidrug transport system fused ATPase/permease subunit